jgi:N-acetylglutamate synthase-like GNAT family acetyltransferase
VSAAEIRPYLAWDRSDCIEIFESNRPEYFDAGELPIFTAFLDTLPTTYFVLEVSGQATGCGGWLPAEDGGGAELVWGMVRANLHKTGLGKMLLTWRLREIAKNPNISTVTMDTSQHSVGFFEKFGFRVTRWRLDWYGPGLHRLDMSRELSDGVRGRLGIGDAARMKS